MLTRSAARKAEPQPTCSASVTGKQSAPAALTYFEKFPCEEWSYEHYASQQPKKQRKPQPRRLMLQYKREMKAEMARRGTPAQTAKIQKSSQRVKGRGKKRESSVSQVGQTWPLVSMANISNSNITFNGAPPVGERLSLGSQSQYSESQNSNSNDTSKDPPTFLDRYQNIKSKLVLPTGRCLEDRVNEYVTSHKKHPLLVYGFIDLGQHTGARRLLKADENQFLQSLVPSIELPAEDLIASILKHIAPCRGSAEFSRALRSFNIPDECDADTRILELYRSAYFWTADFFEQARFGQTLLEGDFDGLWYSVVDLPLRSSMGQLVRKEKVSKLSSRKIDGLLIAGVVVPQEWVAIEVARQDVDKQKNLDDKEKLIKQCLLMANAKRECLIARLRLKGPQLDMTLRKLPVWGILCQGWRIEVFKFVFVTPSVGIFTSFVGQLPENSSDMSSLSRILNQVLLVRQAIQDATAEWKHLFESLSLIR